MSQAVAALSRNLISIFVCLSLAACNGSYTAFESDVDFNVDVKTADLKQDNAELFLLAAYQSAFLGHYQSAAYLFLDASDLPEDAVPTSTNNQFQRICSNGGTALYSYTRNAGEAHKVGDGIFVSYEKCIEGDFEYNGSMKGTYSKLRGLNDRFVTFGNVQCLNKLQSNLAIDESYLDIYTYDAEREYFVINNAEIAYLGDERDVVRSATFVLPGDDIRFTRVGSELKVDILTINKIERAEGGFDVVTRVDISFFISKDKNVIFIVMPKVPEGDMVASIDGDQFYTVENLENTKENCQGYERTLDVNFYNFSTKKTDYLTTTLNGSVTLFEAQETSNRVNQSIVNSDFNTTVTQGYSTEVYSMKDYNVEKALNLTDNSYSYGFDGLVSNSNVFGGQIAVTTEGKLLGSFSSLYPYAGAFEIRAKGLERIYMVPDNLKTQLRVDYDGDSTGNGFGDFDIYINTTWLDLFERNFKES
jgi:hypothetical protein